MSNLLYRWATNSASDLGRHHRLARRSRYETTGWDLYKKDLGPGGSVEPVCPEPGNQLHAEISGDTIVWTDYRAGESNGYDIYLWDPLEGEQPLCTEPGFQGEPDISGDIVVWEDARTGILASSLDIYMAYLSKTPPVFAAARSR